MTVFNGQCQCGRVKVAFTTADPAALKLRACQCSFCRRHGSHTVSDPAGRLVFTADAGDIHRYQFGMRSADFLICTNCGTYVGVVARIAGADYGSVNVVGADIAELATRPASPVNLDNETRPERDARRVKAWTPVIVEERAKSGA